MVGSIALMKKGLKLTLTVSPRQPLVLFVGSIALMKKGLKLLYPDDIRGDLH